MSTLTGGSEVVVVLDVLTGLGYSSGRVRKDPGLPWTVHTRGSVWVESSGRGTGNVKGENHMGVGRCSPSESDRLVGGLKQECEGETLEGTG